MVYNRLFLFTVVLLLLIQFSCAEERTQLKSASNTWLLGQKCEIEVPCHACNPDNSVRMPNFVSSRE